MKNLKKPARLPRKAPSNQTGGTAWGKKLTAEFSRMAQAADMKKLILLNFPYIIAFYMVEKAAWLYRHCNGDSVVDRLMVLFMNFGLAYKSALPSFHPFDLMVGLVGAAVLKAVIYFKGKNAKKYRQGEEYGSARWGNQKDIEPFIDPVFENNVILTQTERLMMSGRPLASAVGSDFLCRLRTPDVVQKPGCRSPPGQQALRFRFRLPMCPVSEPIRAKTDPAAAEKLEQKRQKRNESVKAAYDHLKEQAKTDPEAAKKLEERRSKQRKATNKYQKKRRDNKQEDNAA